MSYRSAILGGLVAATAALLARHAALTWGSDAAEPTDALPGDGLIPDPSVSATRAITIAAPRSEVWPWLVQLGWEHGGFYSYETLENLFGFDVHNAVAVSEAWQGLDVGDAVHVVERFALRVCQLVPDRYLVLLGTPDAVAADSRPPFDFSWAFVLSELPPVDRGPVRTRLVVRERYRAHAVGGRAAIEAIQPVSFLMTQKMLRGIRDRVQGAHPSA
ncbi:MAG TPA: hypothetical protein VFP34_00540 [Microlunatus sp.]|nr:hypothetical protein [Microlunatus sp.]